jgi:4-alpha-glucanotransferase
MPSSSPLQQLARLYQLQITYRDGFGQYRTAPPESILKVMQLLGAAVEGLDDVPGALRERRQQLWQRAIEPVIVAWDDHPLQAKFRLPVRLAEAPVTGEICLEDGARLECRWDEERSAARPMREIEGSRYVERTMVLRAPLALGYHELHLRVGDLDLRSDLFAAPQRAYTPPENAGRWGLFCPLYALHSERSWGAGDFSDLAELAGFVGALNGSVVGTLPMLAGFLDEPFNPSPYAPVSRLFWNEFYLDIAKIPEFPDCRSARAIADAEVFARELSAVRMQSLVDYRKTMALKRRVLEALLDDFFSKPSWRRDNFENFFATDRAVRDYAEFRAKNERERKTWSHWAEQERAGVLVAGSYDERAKRYHGYVQWLCAEQMRGLAAAPANSAALYLDFPLGVNRDGYDVWRERDLFVLQASGGAPPDSLFAKGQNWGFPPFDPGAVRRDGYRYYRAGVRQHMAAAAMLRIDHVMGLHRAFWVPDGFSAADGLYVHQRAEEYYAVLSLESHRHGVQVVGENLGTVPAYVNEALSQHKVLGMHVGQFVVGTDQAHALEAAPTAAVASLNTHDTPTFMSFWRGADIDDRLALGLIDAKQAQQEHGYRGAQREALIAYLRGRDYLGAAAGPAEVYRAWLEQLAASPTEFLLVNLEDLWLETEPQNVPGTWQERPNWQRKARLSLEEIRTNPEFASLLRTVGDKRRPIS